MRAAESHQMRRELFADVAAALDLAALGRAPVLGAARFTEGVTASIAKRSAEFHGC
jgi:hypothetical protein